MGFARVGSLFGGPHLDPEGGIVAVTSRKIAGTSRNQAGWSVAATTSRMIQEWKFTDDGQEFVTEFDVHDTLHDTLSGILGLQDGRPMDLEIVDASIGPSSTLTILVKFTSPSQQQTSGGRRQLSYAIAEINDGAVSYMKTLPYTHEADPRPLSGPRIHLASSEKLCFVTFPDLVIATFLDPKAMFEESVALKDAAKDRLLGASIGDTASLIVLAAHTGFLSLDIDVSHIQRLAAESSRLDPADLATRNLKNKLEQAVLFADNQENPLTCYLA